MINYEQILAVIVKEPLLKGKQVSEGSTKVLLFTLGNQVIPCKDCGDEKFLVHIDAATDWNSFTHTVPSFLIWKREAGNVPPHIKPRSLNNS